MNHRPANHSLGVALLCAFVTSTASAQTNSPKAADISEQETLYIQSDTPGGEKEANWLPVAKANFTLMMRLYSPRSEVLDGSWAPPPLKKIK